LVSAFVSISIDADSPPDSSNHASWQGNPVRSIIAELVAQSNQMRMPATWAFSASTITPSMQQLVDGPLGHELALLSDPKLAKAEFSRSDIMQTVVRPMQSAADAGIAISTLAVPHAWQPRHVDLLTKYGLTVIRTPYVFSSQTTTGIRAVCHGLWQVPVSAGLQNGRWMANLGQWRYMRRAVDCAVQQGGWCHLRIDAASIAHGDVASGLRSVGRLLHHLHQLRSGGHIVVETLCGAAVRLAPRRNVTSAHSILHAA
jgi:hypothetical protein